MKSSKNKIKNGKCVALTGVRAYLPLLVGGLLWSNSASAASDSTTIFGGIGLFWAVGILLVVLKKSRLAIVIASIGALAISVYLGIQHGSTEVSGCNISSTLNCDVVNRSDYSEIMGVPVAFLGSAFYFAVIVLSMLFRFNKDGKYTLYAHFIFQGAVLSVLFSAVLAFISAQILGAWCLFCIGLYGANIILLIASWVSTRSHEDTSFGKAVMQSIAGFNDNSSSTFAGSFIVALIVLVTFLGGNSTAPVALDAEGNVKLDELLYETQAPLVLDGTEPVLGAKDAQFTIVEFADYECPHCGRVAPEIKEFVKENTDVKLLFKHYPISNICNDNIPHEGHTNSCSAAMASECALAQGTSLFWKLNRLTFKNQTALERSNIDFLSKQVGLDMALYASCMEQPETLGAIKADIGAADKIGLTGTPSFYLSGHREGGAFERIEGGVQELSTVIDAVRGGREIPKATSYANQ